MPWHTTTVLNRQIALTFTLTSTLHNRYLDIAYLWSYLGPPENKARIGRYVRASISPVVPSCNSPYALPSLSAPTSCYILFFNSLMLCVARAYTSSMQRDIDYRIPRFLRTGLPSS